MKTAEETRKHIRNYCKARKLLRQEADSCRRSARNMVQRDDETKEQFEERKKDYVKWLEKYIRNGEARLEAADKAGAVFELQFHVYWGKNYEGNQARCEGWVFYTDPEFGSKSSHSKGKRTSGGGYDKYSEAIQYCIDRFDKDGQAAIDRWVIENGEKLWEEYAVDRTPIPHFEFGGKGGSTFTRLFRPLGYRYKGDWPIRKFLIEENRRSKTYDYIRVIRKDMV